MTCALSPKIDPRQLLRTAASSLRLEWLHLRRLCACGMKRKEEIVSSFQGRGEKSRHYENTSAQTKSKGKEIEVICLEKELEEFYLSGNDSMKLRLCFGVRGGGGVHL